MTDKLLPSFDGEKNEFLIDGKTVLEFGLELASKMPLEVPPEALKKLNQAYEIYKDDTSKAVNGMAKVGQLVVSIYELTAANRGPALVRSLEGKDGELYITWRAAKASENGMIRTLGANVVLEQSDQIRIDKVVKLTLNGLDLALNYGDDGEELERIANEELTNDRWRQLFKKRPRPAGSPRKGMDEVLIFIVEQWIECRKVTDGIGKAAEELLKRIPSSENPLAEIAILRLMKKKKELGIKRFAKYLVNVEGRYLKFRDRE